MKKINVEDLKCYDAHGGDNNKISETPEGVENII